jgi:hypothetical protein
MNKIFYIEMTIVSIGFFYKLTDQSNQIDELDIDVWGDVADALMAKFQTLNLTKIKFLGLGYGTVIDYEHFLEEKLRIIVHMNFPDEESLYHQNYRSDLLYQMPKLFNIWYFADPDQNICHSKRYGNLKVVTNRDYLAKVEFEDVYILGYKDNDNIYRAIDE